MIQNVRENIVGLFTSVKFTLINSQTRWIHMVSTWFLSNKKVSKNSLNCCWFIHHQKWSNETNSRFKNGKRSSKNRENVVEFIHHRQIHAHKWSNKMNSRLKTGCEHDFPIAGDETWLSHSVEQNCSGKMKTSMLICLTLLNVKTALPLKIGM